MEAGFSDFWKFCFSPQKMSMDVDTYFQQLDQRLSHTASCIVESTWIDTPRDGEYRIPVGKAVWALYEPDKQWYAGIVQKIMSRNRYYIQFDGYSGAELCNSVEEMPDPEKEKLRISEEARVKVDLIRKKNRDKGGATILHEAAKFNRIDLAKWVLSRGANVYMKTTAGFTALHVAARHNNYHIIGLLLDKGGSRLGRIRSTLTKETAWDVARWAGADDACKLIENRTSMQRMLELQEHNRHERKLKLT